MFESFKMEKVKADKESIQLNAIDKALNELEPSVSKKKGSKFLLSSPTTLDNDLNTLDEPLSKPTSQMRDYEMISKKVAFILNPWKKSDDRAEQLKKWDLWGPLLFCLLLALYDFKFL